MSGKSRIEKILENLLGENNVIEPPIGRDEKILYSILNDLEYTDPPHSIFEDLLLAIKNGSSTETEYAYENLVRDEKILFCKLNRREYFEPPHSRLERLLIKWLYLDLYLNIDGVPPFTFVSNGSPIIDYIISGNTVQSGTPTPDSPVMPQGTGERTGNLCSSTNKSQTAYLRFYIKDFKEIVDDYDTFSLSFKTDVSLLSNTLYLHTTGNEQIAIVSGTGKITKTFTLTSTQISNIKNATEPYIYIYKSNADFSNSTEEMLNVGETPLPYEPYGYKIPISSANTTTPVYLGEVQTTRKVKKLVLDGTENWIYESQYSRFVLTMADAYYSGTVRTTPCICSHYQPIYDGRTIDNIPNESIYITASSGKTAFDIKTTDFTDVTNFKSYLAAQYANGTPVTVWYVLATETTGIVNEPLMKIVDYADSISYEQTVVSIPTVSGRNTFDVLGDVKPSNVEITYVPRAPLLRTRKTILKK